VLPEQNQLECPPRPFLNVRVGITGHRRLDAADASGQISTRIGQLLQQIELAATKLLNSEPEVFSGSEPRLRFLSALAEGADRLGAEAAQALGWPLYALLPFQAEEYETDFESQASISKFRDLIDQAESVTVIPAQPGDARDRAYERIGEMLIHQSDILLAVWNGEASGGRGGTAETVSKAIQNGLAVICIDPSDFSIRLLREHGDVDAISSLDEPGAFTTLLADIYAPPSEGTEARSRLDRFNSRRARRWSAWTAYDTLLWLFSDRPWPGLVKRHRPPLPDNSWRSFSDASPSTTPIREIDSGPATLHAWADHHAVHFADVYRSSYVLAFVLGAVGVVIGLVGLLSPEEVGKWPFILIETVLITFVLLLVRQGRKKFWHRQWLDYRALAEIVRQARLLLPLGHGASLSISREPESDPALIWISWRVLAALREVPPPIGVLDTSALGRHRNACLAWEIGDNTAGESQIEYHETNARRLKDVSHRMETAGEALFGLTVLAGLLYTPVLFGIERHLAIVGGLAAEPAKSLIKYGGTIIMAGLPAIGAALAGIRAQGDFEAFAERSEQTATELENLRRHALEKPPSDYDAMIRLMENAGAAMNDDLAAWRKLYQRKPLVPPA